MTHPCPPEAALASGSSSRQRSLQDAPPFSRPLSLRSIALSLLLAVLFGYCIPITDYRFANTYLGSTHLPLGAVAALLFLSALNALLKRVARPWRLRRDELMVVYTTGLFSALVPGTGGNNYFVSCILGPWYFATPENRWLESLPQSPSWFSPAIGGGRDFAALWFDGLPAGTPIPWAQWVVPLLMWSIFILVSYFTLGALSLILRTQWNEREALQFPLLQLPLEMTRESASNRPLFWRDNWMWVGFGIGVLSQVPNGLNLYYPDFPTIPLSLNTANYLGEVPWNQLGRIKVNIWPFVIGASYLLSRQMSLSLWVCFFLVKLQLVVAYYAGFFPLSIPNAVGDITNGNKPFQTYQEIGAQWSFLALLLWSGREHFLAVLKRALGRKPGKHRSDSSSDLKGEALAFWGFAGGVVFLVGWSVLAGLSIPVALCLWGSYLMVSVLIARFVVEGGLVFVQQGWVPLGSAAQLFGSGPGSWLSAQSGAGAAGIMEMAIAQDLRASLMPSWVYAWKVAQIEGISRRALFALVMAVCALSLGLGVWQCVRLGHQNGALTMQLFYHDALPMGAARNAVALSRGVPESSWTNGGWMLLGGLGLWALSFCYTRFPWWPIHPIGFLASYAYPIQIIWFSVFLGWAIKATATRLGGADFARRFTAPMLGLMLGHATIMLFWLLIDCWQGRMTHQMMLGAT